MTGVRPDTIGITENRAYFRDNNPDIVTLPQHLIANGYEAVYAGKIYHGKMTDDEKSWSRKAAHNKLPRFKWNPGGYVLPENQATWEKNKVEMLAKYGKEGSGGLIHGPAYEAGEGPDTIYKDGHTTQLAIATLKDHLANKPNQPLFLAAGFVKPHLHFRAPTSSPAS